MLPGPSWSGSIQQDLIEKLWVAILTCDTSEPKPSHESHSDKENKKAKESDDESNKNDESEESEENSSEDDSDIDLDMSGLGRGLALVDRNDLFSMVKRQQSQQGETDALDSRNIDLAHGHSGDVNETKESDNSLTVNSQKKQSMDNEVAREENKNDAIASRSSDSCTPSSQNNSLCQLSGAKPKVIVTTPAKVASQGRRPRPNSLNFANCLTKSKIPQLSPVSPGDAPPIYNRKLSVRYNSSQSIKKGILKERKNPSIVNQGKASKIPVSPQKHLKAFGWQDRAHLLDVVPRRRLWSDPRQNHLDKVVKSNPVIWRRRAVTPEAARPYPLYRPTGNKGKKENPDTRRFTQRQYYRGNSSRWATQKNGIETNKDRSCSKNVAVKSKRDPRDDRVTREQGKWKQVNEEEKQKKSGIGLPMSRVISRSTTLRENATKSLIKPKILPNASTRSAGTRMKTQNKDLTSSNPKNQRCKSTAYITKQKQGSTKKTVTKKEEEETDEKVDKNEQAHTESKHNVKELEEGEDSAPQELSNSELSETSSYGNNVEVSRLEDCLKEAILGVLQGLPEGWILVPEHTAELFSSLTSVVESFPRPNHARARVLEAIVDAHSRRPCGKGEIAALNNAHLLLYVGLKLCCMRAGKMEANNNQKEEKEKEEEEEEEAMALKQTMLKKGEQWKSKAAADAPKKLVTKLGKCLVNSIHERGDDAKYGGKISSKEDLISLHKEPEGHIFAFWKEKKQDVDQKNIVLKILNDIQRCEGSFDRLMMCLLLGSRAPGRGSGWYCETEEESEKVRDLRIVLDHLKYIEGCRVSEVVSAPLWSCGSSPVVLAALAESPRLVLALLQYGAGGSAANYYRYSKCYTNGVYLAIAYLVRKLESQFVEPAAEANPQNPEGEDEPPAEDAHNPDVNVEGQDNVAEGAGFEEVQNDKEGFKKRFEKRNLLTHAGHNPTALCLRYLLRAVPRVPIKFLRDQLGGCSRECGREVAYLLPHSCCLQPPTLTHLSRAACRQYLRIYDLLPQIIEDLDVPQTLKDYLNLLRD